MFTSRHIPLKLTIIVLLMWQCPTRAQSSITRSIRSFGAKGDGKTNDTEAFLKAAKFFNARHGEGKLLIPKGVYLVGKQGFQPNQKGQQGFPGADILKLEYCKNFIIQGAAGAKLKYRDSLRFGSFNPIDKTPYRNNNPNVPDIQFAASIGYCIAFFNCNNCQLKQLELDGNNRGMVYGGGYGDKGIQLQHYGVFIYHSKKILVEKVAANYFALDGIAVDNQPTDKPDAIVLRNSRFEYNCRQGLSWVSGNQLTAINCQFNHTGTVAYTSAPAAGVDIEAENHTIQNGLFKNCSFINNKGCGLVADSGPSSDCRFEDCTFWGTVSYSVWIKKPRFTLYRCHIYGTAVHGYNSSNDTDATRYLSCHFEDKPYKGQPTYGNFLVDADGVKRLIIDSCTFVIHQKKIMWINLPNNTLEADKPMISHCRFQVLSANYPKNDFVAVMRGVRYRNNQFEFLDPKSKANGQTWPTACCTTVTDLGGNTVKYATSSP